MLWYKVWRETRWRFLVGLLLMCLTSVMVVLTRSLVSNMRLDDLKGLGGSLEEAVRETITLMATYPGYVWSQWGAKNLPNTWALFAVLIGVGGVVTESGRGTALFTLSLPVTRTRLTCVRALVGASELALLAFVPSLLIPLVSPLIGETYPLHDTLVYALLTLVGGMSFYGFSLLLSSIFRDQLKPIVVGLASVFILNLLPLLVRELASYSPFTVMSGASYFKLGVIPWTGLALSLAVAAAMFVASLYIVERQDF